MSKSKNAILKEISSHEFLSVEDKEVLKSFDKTDLYALIDMLLCDKALMSAKMLDYEDRYNEYLDKNAKMQKDNRLEDLKKVCTWSSDEPLRSEDIISRLETITKKTSAYIYLEAGIRDNVKRANSYKSIESIKDTLNFALDDFDVWSELYYSLSNELHCLIEDLRENKVN